MTQIKTMSVEQLRNRLTDRINTLQDRLRGLSKETHYKQFYNVAGELKVARVRLDKLNQKTGFIEGDKK